MRAAAAILIALAALSSAVLAAPMDQQPAEIVERDQPYARASPTEDDGFEAYRREFVAAAAATGIAKRQGLGGGAGGGDVLTTATGLQTISGYTPPASSAIPQPVVSQGTILNTGQVPGFNASAAAASSPADAVRQPYQIAVAAVGGVAAGAAMFLF